MRFRLPMIGHGFGLAGNFSGRRRKVRRKARAASKVKAITTQE